MLANADEVDSEIVREDSLVDDVPDDARLRQRGAIVVDGHIAKRVEAELELLHHRFEPTGWLADSAGLPLNKGRPARRAWLRRPGARPAWLAAGRGGRG